MANAITVERAVRPDVVLCDLDGVVWLGGVPIAGSVAAIDRLRAAGVRVVFVSNSSAPTIAEHTATLAGIGITADGDVISSSTAAAELISEGSASWCAAVRVSSRPSRSAGATPFDGDDVEAVAAGVDVVIAGLHRTFDYERLRLATTAIRDGARFVATNRDPLFPDTGRSDPGRRVDRRGHRHRHRRGARDRPANLIHRWFAPSAASWGTRLRPSASSSSAIRSPRTDASPPPSDVASGSSARATRRLG